MMRVGDNIRQRSADNDYEPPGLGAGSVLLSSDAHRALHRFLQGPQPRGGSDDPRGRRRCGTTGLELRRRGFEGPAVETPLLLRVEVYSAVVGLLVVLGALFSQARGR